MFILSSVPPIYLDDINVSIDPRIDPRQEFSIKNDDYRKRQKRYQKIKSLKIGKNRKLDLAVVYGR